MGININQGQTPVSLDQPHATAHAHQTKAAKTTKAGHLTGENLAVAQQRGGKAIQGGQQQGIPKPVLNPPNQDPTVASYQAAMGSMDQLVANMQGDVLAGDMNDLADALEEASEEGDGGGADGGVVVGKKGAKTKLRRVNVLAREVKLKNTSQEQAKDFSSQLKELGRQAASNPHSSEKLRESFDQLQDAMKSGEMDGQDIEKMLGKMQTQAQKASGGKEQNPTIQQLMNAGKPAHAMSAGHVVGDISFTESATGYKGTADGKPFNFDFANKSMQFEAEGKSVEMKFAANGGVQASVDGAPFSLGDSEVGTMNQFFMLMALFHEMGVEQRQMSRQARNAANEVVVQKIKGQAQEQRKAATAKLVAGTISGSIKVASGTMTMAGSMKGMKADQAAAQSGSAARPGDMMSRQYQAMGQMFEGVGEAASSAMQYKAALHEAKATDIRAEEEQARFIKQTEQDQMQVAQELSSKARDTFAQTWNQYLQTQQNITRNI